MPLTHNPKQDPMISDPEPDVSEFKHKHYHCLPEAINRLVADITLLERTIRRLEMSADDASMPTPGKEQTLLGFRVASFRPVDAYYDVPDFLDSLGQNLRKLTENVEDTFFAEEPENTISDTNSEGAI